MKTVRVKIGDHLDLPIDGMRVVAHMTFGDPSEYFCGRFWLDTKGSRHTVSCGASVRLWGDVKRWCYAADLEVHP